MSITEEETELRDLLIENLHNNGVLAKLKAQLRSSVFKSLEEINNDGKDPAPQSSCLKDLIANPKGISIIKIICEFLQFLNLEYTLNTLQAEVSIAQDFKVDRKELAKEFNINENNDNMKYPFIWSLLVNMNVTSNRNDTANKRDTSNKKDIATKRDTSNKDTTNKNDTSNRKDTSNKKDAANRTNAIDENDVAKEKIPVASIRKDFIPKEANNDTNNNAADGTFDDDNKDNDKDISNSLSSSSSSSSSFSSTLSTSTNQISKKDKKKLEKQKSSSSSSSWPDSKSKTKKEDDDNKTPTNTNINAKNNENKTEPLLDKRDNNERGLFAAPELNYKLGDDIDDEIEEDIILEEADSKSSSKSELMMLSDETVTSSKDVGADYMEDVKKT